MPVLETPRLILWPWRDGDLDAFEDINADPRVLTYLPGALTRLQTTEWIERIQVHFAAHGFGLWAVEVRGGAPCIGYVGLTRTTFAAPFTPAVEIGWRLAAAHWNRGYATEGARAAVAFGFASAGLREIVSFTVPENLASRRVMEKLGMTHDPADDFDHPKLPEGHRLRRHVLYRLANPATTSA